jgi:hypothetical protein
MFWVKAKYWLAAASGSSFLLWQMDSDYSSLIIILLQLL